MRPNTTPLVDLSDVQRGYLAGIIDGEGCITIGRRFTKSGKGFMVLEVIVQMDHEATIERLWKMTGCGNISLTQRPAPNLGVTCRWTSLNWQGAAILEAIRPILITKADEADVALEFAATLTGAPVSREVWVERNRLYQTLRSLKPSSRLRGASANDERFERWLETLPA